MMFKLDLQLFASKKGVGSTKNGRDSKSKRLGAKLSDGQFCTAGSIIYRQRGTKIHPGTTFTSFYSNFCFINKLHKSTSFLIILQLTQKNPFSGIKLCSWIN